MVIDSSCAKAKLVFQFLRIQGKLPFVSVEKPKFKSNTPVFNIIMTWSEIDAMESAKLLESQNSNDDTYYDQNLIRNIILIMIFLFISLIICIVMIYYEHH